MSIDDFIQVPLTMNNYLFIKLNTVDKFKELWKDRDIPIYSNVFCVIELKENFVQIWEMYRVAPFKSIK